MLFVKPLGHLISLGWSGPQFSSHFFHVIVGIILRWEKPITFWLMGVDSFTILLNKLNSKMSVYEHRCMAIMMVQHTQWPTRAWITNTNSKKHTIHISAQAVGDGTNDGYVTFRMYLMVIQRVCPLQMIHSECKALTSNGTKAWTLIVVSIGPSRPEDLLCDNRTALLQTHGADRMIPFGYLEQRVFWPKE
jgi:hypothetical protein